MSSNLRSNALDDFLTNGGKFNETHPFYSRVYLLNAVLFIMLLACIYFVIVNICIYKMYTVAFINGISVLLTFFSLLYFKKTNNYTLTATFVTVIMILSLTAFFYVIQNRHFALYWIAILPPLIYFFFDHKKAALIVGLYGVYMLFFLLFNQNNWQPAVFDGASILNITGVTIGLTFVIAFFERSRNEVWAELQQTNVLLGKKRNELKNILDTVGEGVFGVDTDGKCIFCNDCCLNILSYQDESDLIGKDMFGLVYGKEKDGSLMDRAECDIDRTILSGEKTNAEDKVFWRADNKSFQVEFFSQPMYKGDQICGAVITFTDISERKKNEEKLHYLCHHDTLTGLINRERLRIEMQYLDEEEYLPLSVVYCDLNSLKLTNDIFGHEEGDNLIRTAADVLASVSRKHDIIARIGGDEFVWLLPNTDSIAAKKIMDRVKNRLSHRNASVLTCSMAMGTSTRVHLDEGLDQTLENAENEMYLEKSAERNSYETDTLRNMIDRLHESSPYDKSHSENVSLLCEKMGVALRWPKDKIRILKDAGYYHDIGKIVMMRNASSKVCPMPSMKSAEMNQHPIIGFRIMNLFSNTQDLAESIYYHHERWDGTGYPKGLKGAEIPVNSRIIAIAEQYDHLVNSLTEKPESKEKALMKIQLSSGTKFDPMLAELFVLTQSRPTGVLSGINLSGRASE